MERLAAGPVEVGPRHASVDPDRHRERAAARARALLVEDGAGEEVGARPTVLLVVFDAEQAQLAHPARQIVFGMRPAASHASPCGITSCSTKLRTEARNISCCSSTIFSGPSVAGTGSENPGPGQRAGGPPRRPSR